MSLDRRPILVIDDDLHIREALVDTLGDEGYSVVAVGDGAAGLAYLRDNAAPAIVLLDWNMTPMNGGAFMVEFGKEPKWASIPVVLLSADERIEEKSRQAPFAALFRKPVRLPDLLSLLTRYCG